MKTVARLFVALVMTLSLLGSGAVLQSGTAAPAAADAIATKAAKGRKCDYNPGYRYDSMRVKGMTCKRGKRLADRAYVKWLNGLDGYPFRSSFGNFRCTHSGEYVANAHCRSRSAPKKRWFWFHAGE